MGHLTTGHLALILLSIVMWVGAAWVILVAARKMGLFGRREK